jgi:PAS domain S-box-containing protein
MERGEKFYFEDVLVPNVRQGSLCDVYWTYTYSPVRDTGGTIRGVLVVCHDVTEKLAVERERDAIAASLKNVLNSTTDGFAVLDKEWRYTYMNLRGAGMISMRPDDLIGHCIWELFPGSFETPFGVTCRQAVESGQPGHVTAFYPEPLNVWLECRCYPSEHGLSVYFRDVTEQKRAAQMLALSEARYRSLVHATADIITAGKVEGTEIADTSEFQAFTGLTAAQVGHLGWAEAIHPDDREKAIASWTEAVENGSMFELEHRLRRHDGVFRTMLVRGVPVRNPSGEVVEWISAHTDITERKLAEAENTRLMAAVQKERDWLMALISSVNDEVWFTDAEGNFTWANWVAVHGFGVDTAAGVEVETLVQGLEVLRPHHSPRPVDEAPPLRALRGEVVQDLEEIVRTPVTGELRHRRISSAPVRDAGGQIIGSVSVVRDITERKRAEEALREAQSRFRKLFDSDLMGIAIPDRFGAFRESNDELLRMTGYTRADQDAGLVRWDTMTPPEYAELDAAHIREAAERGSCTPYEKEYIRKDGTRVPILCGYALLEGSEDEYIGFVVDLSQQKQAEAELREREERFRILAESLPQLICMTNGIGENIYCNQRYYDYLGLTEAQMTGLAWRDRIHPDDLANTLTVWSRCVETGENYLNEFRVRRHDGQYRYFLARAVPIRNDAGEIDRWIGSATDIHDQKLAEDALRRSEKLATAGRLAASIAHEINNPLEAVTNSLYLALLDPSLNADTKTYLQTAEQELRRVAHITTQTLRFHKQSISPTRVDVCDIVDSVLALFGQRLANKNIRVKTECERGSFATCLADEVRQVIANLVSNAMDATPEDGTLRLRVGTARSWTQQRQDGIRIVIADTGHGIPSAVLHRIFEPFVSTKEATGVGLGLWVSDGIVRKHGGAIRVRSRTKAQPTGTVFTVFLPSTEIPGPTTHPSSPTAKRLEDRDRYRPES